MKYFAVFLPMLDKAKSGQYRPQHLAYLEKLNEEGHIYAFGPFVDGAGGLIIYQTASREEAERFAREDPYVVHKARDYEVHEWDMRLGNR